MAKKILVIDDEELVTTSLKNFLKKEGYIVFIAQSYQEAMMRVEENTFDLIVSDIRMPGKDGIETIQSIREYLLKNNKKLIPEVLITGFADESKYKKALELEVKAYIKKPFNINDLLEAITEVLS